MRRADGQESERRERKEKEEASNSPTSARPWSATTGRAVGDARMRDLRLSVPEKKRMPAPI